MFLPGHHVSTRFELMHTAFRPDDRFQLRNHYKSVSRSPCFIAAHFLYYGSFHSSNRKKKKDFFSTIFDSKSSSHHTTCNEPCLRILNDSDVFPLVQSSPGK